jgi:DNA-binding response OmpR family regulator
MPRPTDSPAADAAGTTAASGPSPSTGGAADGLDQNPVRKLVVLAEDSPDVQGIVRHALEADGCTVIVAADGAETLRTLEDKEPDLLVLDLMMPRMNGVEVLRTLRDAGRLERFPVLVLTARSSEGDMAACLEMGASDYVTKPFRLRELRTRARALLALDDSGGGGGGDAPD